MATDVVLTRFSTAQATEALDERTIQVDAVPEQGAVWWYGEPYVVRSVSDDDPPRVEIVLDGERLLRHAARVPPGFTLHVHRPAGLELWDAVVLNVEGGVSGYGRDPGDGDAAAGLALKDAGL